MEGKTVILSVLIMSLVMAEIQVEADPCCPSHYARNLYIMCRASGSPMSRCIPMSGCKYSEGGNCPPGYPYDVLGNHGDAVNEYCKLGCTSSVCGAVTTLQNSDASEIVNGAVEQCTKACSTFCSKGPVNAVETA